MDKDFYKLVTQKLAEKLGCETQDIYVVWQCKTLQNIKGLFSSDVKLQMACIMKQHTTGIKVSYI